jgi:hypothetical protein
MAELQIGRGFVQNEKVSSAVEILYMHQIPSEKRLRLTEEGMAWVEIRAGHACAYRRYRGESSEG